ncbi:hypothetical protein [Nicoliella lavandulae]|uniref:Uncharacterized protein n=1 Tax=Nicoliella lavandulae TaxID=3082954 RepID=A0ABU8SMQ9_9LACO
MKIDFDLNRIKAMLNDSKEIHSAVRVTDDSMNIFNPEMPHFKVEYEECSINVGSDDDDESVFTFKDVEFLNTINFDKLSNDLQKLTFAKETLSTEFGIEVSELNVATKYEDQFSEAGVVEGILKMIDGFDWVHHYLLANEKLL